MFANIITCRIVIWLSYGKAIAAMRVSLVSLRTSSFAARLRASDNSAGAQVDFDPVPNDEQ